MRARHASFVISASDPQGFPPAGAPEIAFAGRSNVGKSSLINTLVGVHGLARTSATPGRTRLLNWFKVIPPTGPELAFVDLPGYGYAKVSREMRRGFGSLIESYVQLREALTLAVVIVDARRGAEDEEKELLLWLAENHRKALVVLTKADKIPKNKRIPVAEACKRDLGLARAPILFSAQDGDGIAELWKAIAAAI